MSLFKKNAKNSEEADDSGKPVPDPMDVPAEPEQTSDPDLPGSDLDSLDELAKVEEKLEKSDAAPVAKGRFSGLLSLKFLFIFVPAFILLVTASGLLLFKLSGKFGAKQTQNLEPVTSITRPIPVPDYREMLDFLVLNEADDQKNITSLRIEVCFSSPSRYQVFKDRNVVFRDTVYSFLQKQNAARNTTRNWQTVVEKELLEYLKVSLPQSWADAIKLTQVENL